MDNTVALGIQPLRIDVATPLMQAAKIRQAQMETQNQDIQMRRDAIGAEARGLAPYVGKPEFDEMHAAAGDRLQQQGVLNTPQALQGWDTVMRSPLGIQSTIARTEDPKLGLARQTLEETKRHSGVEESQGQQKINLTSLQPVKIGEDMNGDIFGVKDPTAPQGYRIIDPRALRAAGMAQPGAQPGGPQPGAPAPQPGAPVQPGAPPAIGGAPTAPVVGGAPGAVPVPAPGAPAVAKTEREAAGQKYLDENFPKENHKLIEDLADYNVNPQTIPMKQRTKLLTAASNLAAARGEVYDQANYAMRSSTMQAFAKGKESQAVRAFNVGLEHLDQLGELGKALDNGDIPKLNALKNWVKTNLGQDAPTNFNGLKALVGAEIVKAIVGAGGTGEERAAAAKTVADASSPAQLAGIIKTYKGAMGAQLGGLERQYETGTLRKDFRHKLSPEAVRAIEEHERGSSGGAPAGGAGAVAEPVTSGKTQSGVSWSVQ